MLCEGCSAPGWTGEGWRRAQGREREQRKRALGEERLRFVFKGSSILCQLNWF